MNLFRFISVRGLHRSNIEIALDLIYAATDIQYPVDKIILGTPETVDIRQDISDDPNTFIPVISIADGIDMRFNGPGEDGFLYRRIPLSFLTPQEDVVFEEPSTFPYSTHALLEQINIKLNAQLTQDDILDIVITDRSTHMELRANPSSLVWTDSLLIPYSNAWYGGLITENGHNRITEAGLIRALEATEQS